MIFLDIVKTFTEPLKMEVLLLQPLLWSTTLSTVSGGHLTAARGQLLALSSTLLSISASGARSGITSSGVFGWQYLFTRTYSLSSDFPSLSHPADNTHHPVLFSFQFSMCGVEPAYLHFQQDNQVKLKDTKVSEHLDTQWASCATEQSLLFCAIHISWSYQDLSNQWIISACWDHSFMKRWTRIMSKQSSSETRADH